MVCTSAMNNKWPKLSLLGPLTSTVEQNMVVGSDWDKDEREAESYQRYSFLSSVYRAEVD